MYHRFDENKYPSTNIQMDIFKEHIAIIKKLKIEFLNPINLKEKILKPNEKKKVLITIDDGFESFYNNAWPFLKENKIPFILFVSTKDVGKKGYMSWKQIKELENSKIVVIGNHSHTHDYLVDETDKNIIEDIEKSINSFKDNLGYNPEYFSYPFGEYSSNFKKIINDYNFTLAFGQHSGVIDSTKDLFELPRFPINENYGELDRFKFIIKTLPFQFKKIYPENKYLLTDENPPDVKIYFFEEQKNLKNITCYSNDSNKWKQSEIVFKEKNILHIKIKEKFTTERGRINCSLNDNGFWRWLGIQFVISEY